MATSSNTKQKRKKIDGVCPICGGVGFIRLDLPVTDPNFGKLQPCSCKKEQIAQAASHRLFEISNLTAFKDMTFDNFRTQGRTGLAEQQIARWSLLTTRDIYIRQNLKGWLLLMGNYGCGKTHLAAAVANFVVSLGIPTIFLTVPDLLDWLRFSYDDPDTTFEERFDEIRNIHLLVLDDLGTQNATPWAAGKALPDHQSPLYASLPMVITTNLDLAELDRRDPLAACWTPTLSRPCASLHRIIARL